MKRVLKPVLITILILGALTAGGCFLLFGSGGATSEFYNRIAAEQSDEGDTKIFRYDTDKGATPLLQSGEGKNVLNFGKDNVYSVANSNQAMERIDRVKKRLETSFDDPIIALNPFGTNDASFYFYFETSYRGMIRYTVTVADEGIADHVRYVNNGQEGNLTTEHEFTVGGLVPGMTNYIRIEVLDSTGNPKDTKTYKYAVPAARESSRISVQKGRSEEGSENGLFFLFPKGNKAIYVYDNGGVLRNVINTESGHGRRIYQTGDSVLYQVSGNKVAKVSGIGAVTGTVTVQGYGELKDFSYDGYDSVYALVTKKKRDCLVAASMSTGKTKEIFRFPKGVKCQSLTSPRAGSLYIACASPGGLIRMDAITGMSPRVSYVFGRKKDWKKYNKKKTGLKNKIVEEKSVVRWNLADSTLVLDEQVSNGSTDKIYTYLLDNGKGTGMSFRIDSKNKSVEPLDTLPEGKSGKSSCIAYGRHFIIGNNPTGVYEEYDKQGNVVKQFSFGKEFDSMTKLSLNSMCFYSGQ